jgi:hypothetical protein
MAISEHECKFCGAMTTHPNEECYRNPNKINWFAKELRDNNLITERDFAEEMMFHENGCYQHICILCKLLFYGHKRRMICKACQENSKSPFSKRIRKLFNDAYTEILRFAKE